MTLVVLAVVVLAPVLFVWSLTTARRNFDEMVEPADDLKRADDGRRMGLGDHDGTGGLV